MATSPKITPPFAWLGRHAPMASLIATVAIGAFFRFYKLGTLPPGLYNSPAAVGLQALALIHHAQWPALTAANAYSPLWVWLQTSTILIFGHTALALRIWPALLGTLAVLTIWLWARAWFGLRVGWLAAFFLAVTPWAVTLSRDGSPAALYPLLITLTLWLATRALRGSGRWRFLLLAAALTLCLLSGPLGWLTAASVLFSGVMILTRRHQLVARDQPRWLGFAALIVGTVVAAYLAVISISTIKHLSSATALTASLTALGSNILNVLLMFNVTGDQNFRHNLAGQPMLNAFVGLMFVAGLLVSISRLHERRYRFLLGFTLVMLIPAVVSTTGVPNAAHAVGLLPFVLALAATGTSYLLDLWYATFPINSAARSTGQAAIIVLLALTLFQGYTQYFRAWAGSDEVYAAYNEGTVAIAGYLTAKPFTGNRYVVASTDELPIVAYLNYPAATYAALQPAGIATLPASTNPRQFLIAADARDASVKILQVKFPGGVLRPGYSGFNQAEIYYVYVTGS